MTTICSTCGKVVRITWIGDTYEDCYCTNPFCPDYFRHLRCNKIPAGMSKCWLLSGGLHWRTSGYFPYIKEGELNGEASEGRSTL